MKTIILMLILSLGIAAADVYLNNGSAVYNVKNVNRSNGITVLTLANDSKLSLYHSQIARIAYTPFISVKKTVVIGDIVTGKASGIAYKQSKRHLVTSALSLVLVYASYREMKNIDYELDIYASFQRTSFNYNHIRHLKKQRRHTMRKITLFSLIAFVNTYLSFEKIPITITAN